MARMQRIPEAGALPLDTILGGDCIEVMRSLPEASVDLIFADPPYNLQLKGELHRPDNSRVDAVDDHWDRFSSFAAYDEFTRAWLAAARRLLKPDGALWVIGSYHNVFRLGTCLQDAGFWILNDVVWRKSNPMPNFRGKRLTNAHETLIWAARSEGSRYTFNYEAMKALNEGVQMRSDWVIPLCTGSERLKTDDRREGPSDPEARGAAPPGPRRIDAGGRRGARSLLRDRHDGCRGQAAAAALDRDRARGGLSRRGRGADRRGAAARRRGGGGDDAEARRSRASPSGSSSSAGSSPPGETLVSLNGRHAARIRADGTLVAAEVRGSIHQVGAALEGAPSCNGWTYWHVKRDGVRVPIDFLREQVRAEMRD